MSSKSYIMVNEQRVYNWTSKATEFTCDACQKVMEDRLPAIHLTVSAEFENTPFPAAGLLQQAIDLHPGCMNELGKVLSQRLR